MVSGTSVGRGVTVVAVVLLASALTAAVLAQTSRSTNAGAVKPVVVAVTAGKPTELAFKLSRYSLLPVRKPIEFMVSDGGVAFHDFKICTAATTSFKANTCTTGVGTKVLHPSQSATLTVTLKKAGKYEFLCTLTGHAAGGMKGLIGVGVTVTAAEETAAKPPTTTTTTTSTTPTTTTTTTTKSTTTTTTPLSECPPGVTISTSGNTDNDNDENGAPSDLDGCI
jgi:uncharacterized cupredoxin-like copper-binding protein